MRLALNIGYWGSLPVDPLELAGRIAQNAPQTNFAVVQALPRIAEAHSFGRAAGKAGGGDDRVRRPRDP